MASSNACEFPFFVKRAKPLTAIVSFFTHAHGKLRTKNKRSFDLNESHVSRIIYKYTVNLSSLGSLKKWLLLQKFVSSYVFHALNNITMFTVDEPTEVPTEFRVLKGLL